MTDVEVGVEDTPDGRRIEVSRSIRASGDRAWDLLVDTRRWPDWGPTVTDVDSDRRRISAGTRGRFQVLGGPWLPFEIRTCTDRRWTWRVARVPATGHRVEDVSQDECRVAFEVPFAGAPYLPVCRRALDRIAWCLRTSNGES